MPHLQLKAFEVVGIRGRDPFTAALRVRRRYVSDVATISVGLLAIGIGNHQERGFPLRCRQMLTGAGRRRQGSSGRPTSRLGGAVRGPRGGGGGGRVRPALRSDW